jgi:hypothetical protein
LYEQPFRQVGQYQQQQQQQQQQRATPTPTSSPATPTTNPNFGRYRTELVYDPTSGQYNSVVVQANANSNQEFELTQKLRAFAHPTEQTQQQQQQSNQNTRGFTQFQQFGQPNIQYYHQPSQPQQQVQPQQPRIHSQPQHQSAEQDPTQINQYLARHAYRQESAAPPQQQLQHHQQQSSSLQFIPPHLRPGAGQTAEFQQQEVREIPAPRIQSGNSAAASNGQIDAFLRALNISI